MRTALILALALLVGCGSRTPGGSDGGAGDGPVPPRDAAADGSAPDGAAGDAQPDGPAPDGVVQHDAGHDVNRDGAYFNECVLAGGTCVGVFPNNCPGGEIVGLSCGGGVGVACCMPGDGGTGCLPRGGCAYGPPCGLGCCKAGERCDPATTTCRCGTGAACTGGNTCASPVVPADQCGVMCCGVTTPCPV
jgi:hypothetical protein